MQAPLHSLEQDAGPSSLGKPLGTSRAHVCSIRHLHAEICFHKDCRTQKELFCLFWLAFLSHTATVKQDVSLQLPFRAHTSPLSAMVTVWTRSWRQKWSTLPTSEAVFRIHKAPFIVLWEEWNGREAQLLLTNLSNHVTMLQQGCAQPGRDYGNILISHGSQERSFICPTTSMHLI